jgi:hypothetical protein
MAIVLITVGVLTLVLLLYAIVSGSLRGGGTGFAALTSFHDFQTKDKREAVEVVIDQKAGRERFSQSNQGRRGKEDEALTDPDQTQTGIDHPLFEIKEYRRDAPEHGGKGKEDESKQMDT